MTTLNKSLAVAGMAASCSANQNFAFEWGHLSSKHSFSVITGNIAVNHCRKLNSFGYISPQTVQVCLSNCDVTEHKSTEFGEIT